MKLRCIFDIHLGSTQAIMTFPQVLDAIRECPAERTLIYGGDNGDLVNSTKGEGVILTKNQASEIKARIVLRGGKAVRGNHELNTLSGPDNVIVGDRENIWIEHGDIAFWGPGKSSEYRSKSPGRGWLKRHFITAIIEDLRAMINPGPNTQFRSYMQALSQAYPHIEYFICGHRHPKKLIEVELSGIKCLICARGVTDLELE